MRQRRGTRAKLVQAKRDLLTYIGAYASAKGAAEWTNGYRVGNPEKEAEKHAHEMRQWEVVGRVEKQMRYALQTYTRLVRKNAKAQR